MPALSAIWQILLASTPTEVDQYVPILLRAQSGDVGWEADGIAPAPFAARPQTRPALARLERLFLDV